MVGEKKSAPLTDEQIGRLAAVVAMDDMEKIAQIFFGISSEKIKNTRSDYSKSEAFNREILRIFANKNADNQVEVLNFC